MERAGDLVSKAAVQAGGTEVVSPDVKVGKLSECGDAVADRTDQSGGIPSSTIVWVRADGAYFSIARYGGASARHGNQVASIANAAITSKLDRAMPEGARFGESSKGHHFRYVIFAEVFDVDISG